MMAPACSYSRSVTTNGESVISPTTVIAINTGCGNFGIAHNMSLKPQDIAVDRALTVLIYITFKFARFLYLWAGIAQSVLQLATGWTVRGSNPGGSEIFRTCPARPWGPPSFLHNRHRVFPGGKVTGAWRRPSTII
jgi:hypothetical protein